MSNSIEEKRESIDHLEFITEEEELKKFLTFFVGEECFAFNMDILQEIIWVPETVKVPLTPSCFVGLTNLRGSILPLIDIRKIFNMGNTKIDEDTRAIIINIGFTIGIVVDKVDRVIEVMPDRIEEAHGLKSQAKNIRDYLKGVIKFSSKKTLIQIIDIQELIKNEFTELIFYKDIENKKEEGDKKNIIQPEKKIREEEEKKIISFFIGGQEFGFEVENIKEIIKFPEEIHKIPNSDSSLLGMMNYRDKVLPLIDLGAMIGLKSDFNSEHSKVLVIEDKLLEIQDPIGFVIDKINEIIGVDSGLTPVPELILNSNSCKEIKSICQLDKGKRIISIFSVEDIIKHPDVEDAMSSAEELKERRHRDKEETHQESIEKEIQLVSFMIGEQEFAIFIKYVQEIILIPEEINLVPHSSEYMEGVINLRGAVLPVIDMRKRLKQEIVPKGRDSERILVINVDDKDIRVGFIVDSVTGVLSVYESKIEDAPELSEPEHGLVKKIVNLEDEERIILVLDTEILVEDSK